MVSTVFEPFSNVVLPAGVLVIPAVVQLFKGTAYVPVINVGSINACIPSRCALGTLKPAQIAYLQESRRYPFHWGRRKFRQQLVCNKCKLVKYSS